MNTVVQPIKIFNYLAYDLIKICRSGRLSMMKLTFVKAYLFEYRFKKRIAVAVNRKFNWFFVSFKLGIKYRFSFQNGDFLLIFYAIQ